MSKVLYGTITRYVGDTVARTAAVAIGEHSMDEMRDFVREHAPDPAYPVTHPGEVVEERYSLHAGVTRLVIGLPTPPTRGE